MDPLNQKYPLKHTEAIYRKQQLLLPITNTYMVNYSIILCLRSSSHPNQINPANNFEGHCTISFTYNNSLNEDLFLNFNGTIHSIIINQKPTKPNHSNHRIILNHLDLIYNVTNTVTILFSSKYNKSGIGLHHFIDPKDNREYIYSQMCPYECHLVFPCFDQPDIKGSLKLTLIAPDDWVMLSNEQSNFQWRLTNDSYTKDHDLHGMKELLSLSKNDYEFLVNAIIDKNYNVTVFNETPVISCYLYAICAGPYHCIINPYDYRIPLRFYMRQSLKYKGDTKEVFRITMTGIEWYKNFFGVDFPFRKYDQVFVPEYNFGAMENVGLVVYNEHYCYEVVPSPSIKAKFTNTILHELSHMWFGNLVTMTWWDDLWLNEAFATFISYLCQHRTLSNDYKNIWMSFNETKGRAYQLDQKTTTHPVLADIDDTDQSESLFDAIVYNKGSSILKQLFFLIGEENFSEGLKSYFKKFQWQNTKFEDFIETMVEQINNDNSHKKSNVKTICNRWLSLAGLNSIKCIWKNDPNGKIDTFTIEQLPCIEQCSNLQYHFIEIMLIYDEGINIVMTIEIKPEKEYFLPELKGLKAPKACIINHNDWGYLKWIIDSASLDYLKDNLMICLKDNELSRQMCYRSLFDMTRDAVLPSIDYINIISTLIINESSYEIISLLLNQLLTIVTYYLPIKYYNTNIEKLFNVVNTILLNNLQNENICTNVYPFLMKFASSDAHILLIKDWLNPNNIKPYLLNKDNSKVYLNSIHFDQVQRFIICCMCHTVPNSLISIEEKQRILNEEIERDNHSDLSNRTKCYCKAAMPDKESKKEIWEMIVNDNDKESLYNMKEYMNGFVQMNQVELIKEYCEIRFMEDISKLEKKDFFFLNAFVRSCGPAIFPSEKNIKRMKEIVDSIKGDNIMKRELMELGDDMTRFNKAKGLVD